jgi:hypothetical protein
VQTYRVWPEGVDRRKTVPKMAVSKVPPRGDVFKSKVEPDFDGIVRVGWTLPRTPPSLNQWQSMHWGAQKRTKDAWADNVFQLMRVQGLPMNCEWVFASAQIVFRKGAHRDLTNYSATLWKIFPDVLMRVGVLRDDTEKEMKTGPVSLIVDKKLMGFSADPRLMGITKIAVIAKAPEVA